MPLHQSDGSDWPRGTMTRLVRVRRRGVLPDIMDCMRLESEVSALVLSHAHLTITVLRIMFILTVPVYGSRGTIEMLRGVEAVHPRSAYLRTCASAESRLSLHWGLLRAGYSG